MEFSIQNMQKMSYINFILSFKYNIFLFLLRHKKIQYLFKSKLLLLGKQIFINNKVFVIKKNPSLKPFDLIYFKLNKRFYGWFHKKWKLRKKGGRKFFNHLDLIYNKQLEHAIIVPTFGVFRQRSQNRVLKNTLNYYTYKLYFS